MRFSGFLGMESVHTNINNSFIAVAAGIGGLNCDSLDAGFVSLKTACQCSKSAAAFGAFSW
jgi:hypothetical protein